MDENGTFGAGHVSAWAFHSLRLVGHSVNQISKLGAEHLKGEIANQGLGSLTGGRLALYILGVQSSCKDPQDFDKQDLVKSLKTKLSKFPTTGFDHFFQYNLALVALCSSGSSVDEQYVTKLIEKMSTQSDSTHGGIDTFSLGTVALSCIYRGQKDNQNLGKAIRKAAKRLRMIQKKNNGTFGNEASTSLAVQVKRANSTHTHTHTHKDTRTHAHTHMHARTVTHTLAQIHEHARTHTRARAHTTRAWAHIRIRKWLFKGRKKIPHTTITALLPSSGSSGC